MNSFVVFIKNSIRCIFAVFNPYLIRRILTSRDKESLEFASFVWMIAQFLEFASFDLVLLAI